jgi:uncharacterized SAM-binding protein YcdF (DUF218 family)
VIRSAHDALSLALTLRHHGDLCNKDGRNALNNLFAMWGLAAWKPLLTALVLPPFPLLLMMLLGARFLRTRRGLGWFLILLSFSGLWLTATEGVARWAQPLLLTKAAVLTPDRLLELKQEAKSTRMAIVILGGGAEKFAPEYVDANLTGPSLERLRYGLWLSRQTGIPVAFTGGSGWAASEGPSEAEVAAKIAAADFKQALRWTEIKSRDTAENAAMTVPILQADKVTKLLLVTHGWHMPRAMASFKKFGGTSMSVEAAPMGLARIDEVGPLDWMPSTHGFRRNRQVIHEWLGGLAGA